jgi:hypothetical protein
MKVAAVLSFAAAVMAGALDKRACAADNCARQVTGTREGLLPIESRKADCTSFQKTTVTPEAATVTVTVTVDGDAPAKFRRHVNVEARQATEVPTALPAYASACSSDAVRYASVCSCWGITAAVTTAPTPTSTVTSTVTEDYCEDL